MEEFIVCPKTLKHCFQKDACLTSCKLERTQQNQPSEGKGELYRWVKASERLPELEQWVLGINMNSHFADTAFHVCMRNENGWMKGGTFLNITHWQPLPAPPIQSIIK